MAKVLVGYATKFGSTKEVAEKIGDILRKKGLKAEVKPVKEVNTLEVYKSVILGAPLMMGRWHKDAHNFLGRYKKEISERPVAVFALGPVSVPHSEKEWQGSRDQLMKELAKYPWFKPITAEILGGKFDPKVLPFPINRLAGSAPASDARDWKMIREWASKLVTKIK